MKTFIFLFLFLAWLPGWSAITVCPSGCNDTTGTSALQTATATPNSVIQYQGTDTSPLTIGTINTSLTLTSTLGPNINSNSISISSGSNCPISITSSMAGALTISNMSVTNSGTAGSCIFDNSILGNKTLSNLILGTSVASSSGYQCQGVLPSSADVVINNCKFTGKNGIYILAAQTSINPIVVNNSIFYNLAAFGIKGFSANTISDALLNNTDFLNCATAVSIAGPVTGINLLFLNNITSDISVSGTGTLASFSYCGFGKLPSGAGTSCIYGLTASREFCDQTNFYISPAAKTRGNGISITGITQSSIGLNGVMHGVGCNTGSDDMGCDPYSPALCGNLGAGK